VTQPEPDGRPVPDEPLDPEQLDPGIAGLLTRNDAGLVPAIVQDEESGQVLMMAWMDDEALRRTLSSRRSTFYSRSRRAYWTKGETSGHRQWVRKVQLDCDGDTLLLTVRQDGPACHTGLRSCFDSHTLADLSDLSGTPVAGTIG